MRQKIVFALTLAAGLLTIFQGLISAMTFLSADAITILSAVTLYLVTTVTIWKQKLSEEIRDGAIWATILVAIGATIAGFGDLIHAFHISDVAAQITRLAVTFVVLSITLFRRVLWPSDKTKSI